jgi:hypothetical protein
MSTFLNGHIFWRKMKWDFYLLEVRFIYLFIYSLIFNEYKNNLSVKYVDDIK